MKQAVFLLLLATAAAAAPGRPGPGPQRPASTALTRSAAVSAALSAAGRASPLAAVTTAKSLAPDARITQVLCAFDDNGAVESIYYQSDAAEDAVALCDGTKDVLPFPASCPTDACQSIDLGGDEAIVELTSCHAAKPRSSSFVFTTNLGQVLSCGPDPDTVTPAPKCTTFTVDGEVKEGGDGPSGGRSGSAARSRTTRAPPARGAPRTAAAASESDDKEYDGPSYGGASGYGRSGYGRSGYSSGYGSPSGAARTTRTPAARGPRGPAPRAGPSTRAAGDDSDKEYDGPSYGGGASGYGRSGYGGASGYGRSGYGASGYGSGGYGSGYGGSSSASRTTRGPAARGPAARGPPPTRASPRSRAASSDDSEKEYAGPTGYGSGHSSAARSTYTKERAAAVVSASTTTVGALAAFGAHCGPRRLVVSSLLKPVFNEVELEDSAVARAAAAAAAAAAAPAAPAANAAAAALSKSAPLPLTASAASAAVASGGVVAFNAEIERKGAGCLQSSTAVHNLLSKGMLVGAANGAAVRVDEDALCLPLADSTTGVSGIISPAAGATVADLRAALAAAGIVDGADLCTSAAMAEQCAAAQASSVFVSFPSEPKKERAIVTSRSLPAMAAVSPPRRAAAPAAVRRTRPVRTLLR